MPNLRSYALAVAVAALTIPLFAQDEKTPVAMIGKTAVPRSEVLQSAKDQLEQSDLQLLQCKIEHERNQHQIIDAFTRDLVHRQLVEKEAKDRKTTAEAVLASVKAKEVTQADIDGFYEENKARIPQGMTKEAVAPQIKSYLEQQNRASALDEFYEVLDKKYEVKYLIEPFRAKVAPTGPSRGPANAPVTIVEFSDFECPFCQRLNPELDAVRKEFGDKVRIVFRQYPLAAIHPNATKAAEASLCADDQGKFWEMHDALFADRSKLPVAELKKTAAALSLDTAKFDQCLDSGTHAERIKQDLREGTEVGVTGTPAIFINGRAMSGAVPFADLAKIIREELARAGS
jgi:protein-disulfide isomerase